MSIKELKELLSKNKEYALKILNIERENVKPNEAKFSIGKCE